MTTPDPRTPETNDAPDYLWDRSGPPDPFVQRLEESLAGFRLKDAAAPIAGSVPGRHQSAPGARAFRAKLTQFGPIAAMLLLAGVVVWLAWIPAARQGWSVAAVEGEPRADGHALEAGRVLEVGQWLVTDDSSSAVVRVADIGKLDVAPNSRLRIETTQSDRHEIVLDHGRITATITAPPKLFFVQTRAALATDMGCRYELFMPPSGPGVLTVTLGWVMLEGEAAPDGTAWQARVPIGAECRIDDVHGPGTPFRVDAPPALRDRLAALDASRWQGLSDEELGALLALCGNDDAVTVWHMLYRVRAEQRAAVYHKLRALAMLPNNVDAAKVRALDPETMERLWVVVRFN